MVGFEYYGSYKFGNEYLDAKLVEMKTEMPVGYTASKLTWSWDWNKVKRQYSLLAILLVGIYILCAVLFENLKQPFYIVAMVPLSLSGYFWLLVGVIFILTRAGMPRSSCWGTYR